MDCRHEGKVANAFAHDIDYAMKWVEIGDSAKSEDLSTPCRFDMFENELNAALRNCIRSDA